jgi:hypothetical protein
VLRTRAGFAHRIAPPPHPVAPDWPDLPSPGHEGPVGEGPVPFQFSATELLEALGEIRDRHDQEIAEDRELQWEHGTLLAGIGTST